MRSSLADQVNVFSTEIRLHVALKETARHGRSILEYDSGSPSARAYRALALEVLRACGDEPSVRVDSVEPTTAEADSLLDLPILVAQAPESEPEIVAVRAPRAEAPRFETFVGEGWQRWLSSS